MAVTFTSRVQSSPLRPIGPMREAVTGAMVIGVALSGMLVLGFTVAEAAPPPVTLLAAAGAYVLGVSLLLMRLRRAYVLPAFGACNQVTLLRLALLCVLAGLVVAPGLAVAHPGYGWAALVVAVSALALDGIDGWLARRAGLTSAFGARFDMEVDAALILVLATLIWLTGKAGIWVLALGLIRYAFVIGGVFLPWLNTPLPDSFRRKAVCVVQVAVLAALLAPPVAPPVSQIAAGAALLALIWSFAVDVIWLWRQRDGALPFGGQGT